MSDRNGRALALKAAAIETLDAFAAGTESPLEDIARLRGVSSDEVIGEMVRLMFAQGASVEDATARAGEAFSELSSLDDVPSGGYLH